MHEREYRVWKDHARSGVAHDLAYSFPHHRLVAMRGAFCTRGFVLLVRAVIDPLHGVRIELLTIEAQGLHRVVVAATIDPDHHADGVPLTIKAISFQMEPKGAS
jgi:hypothetical protein